MNRLLLLTLSLITFFSTSVFVARGQYYYKDIIANNQVNREFSIIKNKQVKSVQLKSFEDDNEPSAGFFCEKKINNSFSQSQMISRSYITGESLLVTDYDTQGRVVKSATTTPTSTNMTQYEYDAQGKLGKVITTTSSDADSSQIAETHHYLYNDKGIPEKMTRSKNGQNISEIIFKADDKGNIIEEDATGNILDKKYFYYYDDKNQLTDIVHYNKIAQRLLPDYMFEYNSQNLPKQMITIDETARNYFIWKYSYNENNLTDIQKCYSKERRLLGTIEFEYH